MTETLLISLLVFGSVLFLLLAVNVATASLAQRRRIVDKIRSTGAGDDARAGLAGTSPDSGARSALVRLAAALGARLQRGADAESVGRLNARFLQAGIRSRHAGPAYFGFKLILAAGLPAIAFFASAAFLPAVPPARLTFVLAGAAVGGFYLPDLVLLAMMSSRREKISRSFPDALDLMVVCVEAGMGLDATISRVGEEMVLRSPVLAEELRLVSLELRAGKARADALHNLGLRTGIEDVKSLVGLLVQTDRFGTSLAQALRVHSESMRMKRYHRAEEQAARLPVKLIFPLALFILPALFVTILGPAAIRIYHVFAVPAP